LIQVKSLSVRYPGRARPALRDLSFEVAEGETVLLLGPSGSGKSTLALALNGIIPHGRPAQVGGRVLIGGRDTREMQPGEIAALVGVVFQDPESQFCMLTVEDEVAFGLENLRVPRDEMEARIGEALARVGLSAMRGRRLDRLSGGEKQRLALACILAMRTPVIVLDEPTANLDPLGTREFFATLAALRQQHTFVLIEHKLDECAALADRAIVLRPDGSLLAEGPPRSVFRQHVDALNEYGVWMPQVTEFAQANGWPGELPLTVEEAAHGLSRLNTKAQRHEGTKIGKHVDRETGRQGDRERDRHVDTETGLHAKTIGESVRVSMSTCVRRDAPPALEITHLTFAYPGSPPALRDVSLQIQAGDFVALVGPNGSGKSTLAALATGVRAPPRGTVQLFGREARELSIGEIADRAGYVFQNPEHQFVADSVNDELAYSLRARRRPEAEIKQVVDDLLRRFDLSGFAEVNPFTLSQGQKRRLSVATMLAAGQQMLILDEPTFGQDRRGAGRLMGLLADLHRRGVTLLMITHDMRLVAEYAASAIVLDEGRVIYTGTPGELFARPEVMEAARLVLPPMVEVTNPSVIGNW
jgi:energy-coupling factor transport system ATP-binding protein